MTIDIVHAAASGGIVVITIEVMRMAGWLERDAGGKLLHRWRVAGVVAVIVFMFNLIWPWS